MLLCSDHVFGEKNIYGGELVESLVPAEDHDSEDEAQLDQEKDGCLKGNPTGILVEVQLYHP